jgi:hypothetical protein
MNQSNKDQSNAQSSSRELSFVPYKQKDEPPRKSGVVRVPFPVEGLHEKQVRLLQHLYRASDWMNPIFIRQVTDRTEGLIDFILRLLEAAEKEGNDEQLLTALRNYYFVLRLQNGPWSHLPQKNHLLDAPEDAVRQAARSAGLEDQFEKYRELLFDLVPAPAKANFYPEDITEEELDSLGEAGKQVNTLIRRGPDGRLTMIKNEEYYREACREAAGHLREAAALTDDPWFKLYLEARIEELTTGTEEARRIADALWIKHTNPIDIIISTAIEQYQDGWKNSKGAASAAVMVTNRSMSSLIDTILEKVPQLEKTAPWDLKREKIDPETLPKLKFVDVLTWSGDYVTSPMTVQAQSLPNDEWLSKNIGTVNMVFTNTTKAVYSLGTGMVAKEFLPGEIITKYGENLALGHQLHGSLHEIGHTTGMLDADHPKNPQYYFEDEYNSLEETRAELFGMWAADRLEEWGVLDADVVTASHYSMLASLINTLSFVPDQAHNKARNMMFHFFKENGAIVVEPAGGDIEGRSKKTAFSLDWEKLGQTVEKMLVLVGNIKSAGDKKAATRLREQYCFVDPLKDEIEERTKHIPLGRALIFPKLKTGSGKTEGGGTGLELQYPSDFTEQKKFKMKFTLD